MTDRYALSFAGILELAAEHLSFEMKDIVSINRLERTITHATHGLVRMPHDWNLGTFSEPFYGDPEVEYS